MAIAVHHGTSSCMCSSSNPCCTRPFGVHPPNPKEASDDSIGDVKVSKDESSSVKLVSMPVCSHVNSFSPLNVFT